MACKKYLNLIIIFPLLVVFFLATSFFNFKTQEFQKPNGEGVDFVKWASPDETANYVFAKFYAQENQLSIYEQYNLHASDIMHPRSFRSDNGEIKPVSFLGIILIYGSIAKVFSYRIIPFLTPFFASVGLFYFYLLVKEVFGKKNAMLSFLLLFTFPPFVYYTVRSMFHNVLFSVFLIIGLYYGYKMLHAKERKNKFLSRDFKNINWLSFFYASLAGIFWGLTIITRTSELMWLLPLLLFIWLFNIRSVGITKLSLFLSFLFLVLIPVLYFNQVLYSSPILGGYSEMNNSIIIMKDTGAEIAKNTATANFEKIPGLLEKIKGAVFYFGVHPRRSLGMLNDYFIKMFPWLFYLGLSGSVYLLFNLKKKKMLYLEYLVLLALVSVILILYYGSWVFNDNPNPNSRTIGNSYTRYWLPIYMGVIPLAVLAVNYFSKKIPKWLMVHKKSYVLKNVIRYGFVLLVAIYSIKFLLIGSEEGLVYLYQKNMNMKPEWEKLIQITEGNSAIITQYHDKLLFPERKVINGDFSDKNMVSIYADLAAMLPLYYYNFSLGEKDLNYLNSRRLGEVGLSISKVKQVTDDFTLYKINKLVDFTNTDIDSQINKSTANNIK